MKDEIIKEVWKAKDEIAKECEHDLHKLATLLRERQQQRKHETVNLTNRHRAGARAKP